VRSLLLPITNAFLITVISFILTALPIVVKGVKKPTNMTKPSKCPFFPWAYGLGLLLVCVALYTWRLGATPLLDVDEPRYAESARQMFLSGNWITPYFNGLVRFDKPPLFYWLVASVYHWLGVSEFSARLPSALAAIVTVMAVFVAGCKALGARFGLLAGLMLAVSGLMVAIGRMSVTDMTLCAFLTLTNLSLMSVSFGRPKAWLWAGVFSGLAILTKGPVGLALPGLILLVEALLPTPDTTLGQRLSARFATPWFLVAVVLAVGLALPWYWACYQQNGQAFLDASFLHNVTRYSGVVSGHRQGAWFYPVVLLVGFLPWSLSLPLALKQAWLERSDLSSPSQSDLSLKGEGSKGDDRVEEWTPPPVLRYSVVWAVVTFLFFAVAQTKLLTYILPMFPACAMAVGVLWHKAFDDDQASQAIGKGLLWATGLTWLLLLVPAVVALTQVQRLLPAIVGQLSQFPQGLPWAVGGLLVGLAGCLFGLLKKRYWLAFSAQCLGMLAMAGFTLGSVLPLITDSTQADLLRFLNVVGPARLVSLEIVRPSLTFYHQQTVTRVSLDHATDLLALLNTAKHPKVLYVVTKPQFAQQALLHNTALAGVHIAPVATGRRYSLYRVTPRSVSKGASISGQYP
jgi:4-amino-4-deoxy-L-arabinose transferase-like glycosyltransferase